MWGAQSLTYAVTSVDHKFSRYLGFGPTDLVGGSVIMLKTKHNSQTLKTKKVESKPATSVLHQEQKWYQLGLQ